MLALLHLLGDSQPNIADVSVRRTSTSGPRMLTRSCLSVVLSFVALASLTASRVGSQTPGVLGYAGSGVDPTPVFVAANPYGWASPQGFTFTVLQRGVSVTALGAYRPNSYAVNANQAFVRLYQFQEPPSTPLPNWGAMPGATVVAQRNGSQLIEAGAAVPRFNGSFYYAPLDNPVELTEGVRYGLVFSGYALPNWDTGAQLPILLADKFAFESPVLIQPNGTSAPQVSNSGHVVGPAFQFSTVSEPSSLLLLVVASLLLAIYAAVNRRSRSTPQPLRL